MRNPGRDVENYSYSIIIGVFMMLFKYNYNYIVITTRFWVFLSSYINILLDKLLFTPLINLYLFQQFSQSVNYRNIPFDCLLIGRQSFYY